MKIFLKNFVKAFMVKLRLWHNCLLLLLAATAGAFFGGNLSIGFFLFIIPTSLMVSFVLPSIIVVAIKTYQERKKES